MRFICFLLLLFVFSASSFAGVDAFKTGISDGTYSVVSVSSSKECSALCKADDRCRGAVTYQPDRRYPSAECRLNDGLSATSPFAIAPPPPLDLTQALDDLNAYRQSHGLKRVTLDQKLIEASNSHAEDLATTGRAAHEGSDGSSHADRTKAAGYIFSLVAENVATGQDDWATVFKAWQDSPGHNENLLQPDVSHFGVALVYNPKTKYITYWSMLVAQPLG